jgi:hypothetical protein
MSFCILHAKISLVWAQKGLPSQQPSLQKFFEQIALNCRTMYRYTICSQMFLQIAAEHLLLTGPLPPGSPHVCLVPTAAALLTSRPRGSVGGWKWGREWLCPPRRLAESNQQRWVLKWTRDCLTSFRGLDCFLVVVIWCNRQDVKIRTLLCLRALIESCRDCGPPVFGAGATYKFRAK